MLPGGVKERLAAHVATVKRQHERDLARGEGRVVLPFALDRKYPGAPTEWSWQFVFPASRICRDPKWGTTAPRPSGHPDDDDLFTRYEPWGAGHEESLRLAVTTACW